MIKKWKAFNFFFLFLCYHSLTFEPVQAATTSCIVHGVTITINPKDIAAIVLDADPLKHFSVAIIWKELNWNISIVFSFITEFKRENGKLLLPPPQQVYCFLFDIILLSITFHSSACFVKSTTKETDKRW